MNPVEYLPKQRCVPCESTGLSLVGPSDQTDYWHSLTRTRVLPLSFRHHTLESGLCHIEGEDLIFLMDSLSNDW